MSLLRMLFFAEWNSITTCLATLCLATFPLIAAAQTPVIAISAALQRADFVSALRLSDVALRQHPRDLRVLTLRGLAYFGEKKSALAFSYFQRALSIDPAFLPALEGAAQVSYARADGSARPFLQHILQLRPKDQTAHAMLAVIYYRSGDCSEAVDHFRSAQEIVSSQPTSVEEYGVCLAILQRFEEALPVLQEAVQLEPANQLARYNLTLIYWNAGKLDAAREAIEPTLQEIAPSEDVLTLAADIYESLEETQKSIDTLRRAILEHPKDKAAYLQFANLAYKHSSVEIGIDMVNAGLRQLPTEPELYIARGILLNQTPNSAKSVDDFDAAMHLDPQLSFAGIAQGLAKSEAHQDAAALAAFRSMARQHPDDELAQYLLAEALSQEAPSPGSSSFEEGVAAAKRAIILNPKKAEAHDLLASLYLRAGENELTIQQCKAALDLDPNDEAAVYHEILAIRKNSDRSAIPELVQRLAKIRSLKMDQGFLKVYKLVEIPATETVRHPD